jgi:hypothetical protein
MYRSLTKRCPKCGKLYLKHLGHKCKKEARK